MVYFLINLLLLLEHDQKSYGVKKLKSKKNTKTRVTNKGKVLLLVKTVHSTIFHYCEQYSKTKIHTQTIE